MAVRNRAVSIVLSDEEKQQLEAYANSRSLPHSLVTRARVVLLAAQGQTNLDIAEAVGLTRETVSKWRRRFSLDRIAGLSDEMRPGAPRSVDDERIAQLIDRTLKTTPSNGTHWSCRMMSAELNISKSTVQRIWSAFCIQPHRQRHFKLSTDPLFVEKVRDIVGLYLNPPDKALVLCVDEKSQCQALERTQPMLPLGMGYVEGITHDYERHGTTTLFAALNVADGKVLAQCKPRHRHQEFLTFLRHIERNVPKELDVHLIVDNYATHKHANVKAWLAQRPRFHIHFTPSYSSWLNQVERWFGLITERAIRRGTFSSVKELVNKIDKFVKNHNKNCRPFSWTATAESIFEKISRLCERITGTPH